MNVPILSPAAWRAALMVLLLPLFVSACERKPVPAMRGAALPEPLAKPAVTFVDAEGRDYDLRARSEGKVLLLFFGFTHCPDVCPLHMANIAAVLRDLPFEKRKHVEVAFVTVDPERDTPARLREWLAKFDPSFVPLWEKSPGDLDVVNRALYLPKAVTYPAETGGYTVGHASQVVAFTADGLARYVYPFGTRQEDWAHDLPLLIDGVGGKPAVAATAAANPPAKPGETMRVERVLIPEPPTSTAALYADIVNPNGDDVLHSITTPAAKHTALHEQVHTPDGAMAMKHLGKLPVPARQTTKLAPGGYHGMLMGFEGYARGATVPVVFEFENAGRVHAIAQVVGYEELEHHHHDHAEAH